LAEKRQIIRRYAFRPKKRLGQHFLKDMKTIHEIINRSRFNKSDQILEIGAGLGALTFPLAGFVDNIIAVEKDSQLTEMMQRRIASEDIRNITLINEDILHTDLRDILGPMEKKIKVIGNLPYNISSPLLEKLVEERSIVSKAVLMFQLEFARRLIASPGGKEYGGITVLTQYHASLCSLLEVSKEAFYPKPKVGSMVLELDFERPHPRRTKDETKFKMIVKGAFAHRRKTLLNSLKGTLSSHSKEQILKALGKCAIESRRRAESLDIDDFLCLTSVL
jgi:16S rRNA (adenine1518-N6/adenine1519-N6)-dimethyltransferase